jgi:hypothetical protein
MFTSDEHGRQKYRSRVRISRKAPGPKRGMARPRPCPTGEICRAHALYSTRCSLVGSNLISLIRRAGPRYVIAFDYTSHRLSSLSRILILISVQQCTVPWTIRRTRSKAVKPDEGYLPVLSSSALKPTTQRISYQCWWTLVSSLVGYKSWMQLSQRIPPPCPKRKDVSALLNQSHPCPALNGFVSSQ